jgi:hypothetical protein
VAHFEREHRARRAVVMAHVEAERGVGLADIDNAAVHDERRARTRFFQEADMHFLRDQR